eukprot:4543812-Amphidinium_carterae.1
MARLVSIFAGSQEFSEFSSANEDPKILRVLSPPKEVVIQQPCVSERNVHTPTSNAEGWT